VYYGYRHDNPDTGRWLSRDPLKELGGLNLYNYVHNNPVNDFDPLGLNPFINFVAKCSWSVIKSQILQKFDQWHFEEQANEEIDNEIGAGGSANVTKYCHTWHTLYPNVELVHLEKESILESVGGCIFDFVKSGAIEKALKNLPEGALRKLVEKLADEAANRTKEEIIKMLDSTTREEKLKYKCKTREKIEVKLFVDITTTVDKAKIPLGEEEVTSWEHQSRNTEVACCFCNLNPEP
jgi:hypothetical protein